MRVISGKYRGKKLLTQKTNTVRPTTDRAKEGIFSSIQDRLFNANFLDLFSGSGAIGIEALSRGAKFAVFVDKSKDSADIIKKNIGSLKGLNKDSYKVMQASSENFLLNENMSYDIIFMDPPYKYSGFYKMLNIMYTKSILQAGGIIIIETEKHTNLEIPESFEIKQEKIYSISKFTFIQRKGKK